MRGIDLLLVVNAFFVCLTGYILFSIVRSMNNEGGEMAESFGLVLSLPFLIWHLVLLAIGYSKRMKAKEDNTFDDQRSVGRLFIWTFLPWSGIFFLWLFV